MNAITRCAAVLMGLLLLSGCTDPVPLRIGFVAGISGRVADLGISGRNGVTLAIEEANQAGGIDGHRLELLIRDDEQNPETARRVVQELIGHKVEAIIGPMTSSMCMAALDLVNAAQLLMISPTCTSTQFSNIDDQFFRVISATTDYAYKSADYQFHRLGHRKFAAIYDLGNRAYTESWFNDFKTRIGSLGGELTQAMTFTSGPDVAFADLAQQLLKTSADAILIIANSVDAAQLAQHLARLGNTRPLVSAEWAATERLTELGGKAVDGMLMAQFLDRESRQPEYLAFQAAYLKRFNQEPGFAGVAGYDAARVLIEALAGKPAGRTLKQGILDKRQFTGVSGVLEFTAQGDAQRTTYLTRIHEGRFMTLK